MSDRLKDELVIARLIEGLTLAIRQAGSLIESMKAHGVAERTKADSSPVTEADEAAEQLLADAIRALEPEAVIIGEEDTAAFGVRGEAPDRYWLIDPVDGTRSFVEGGSDYSVNIGLVENGVPKLGLVLHSPTGTLWTGAPGLGAWKELASHARTAIQTRPLASPPVILTSRSNLNPRTRDWVAGIPDAEIRAHGSSLKICLIAEGAADIYPRHGRTCEWDTAAAEAILLAAGGKLFAAGGAPFVYGKPGYINPSFIALGDPGALERLPPFAE